MIPLLAQTALNALMPLVVYLFARDEFDERVAATAALLTGVLSFNTVYASTQAGDPLCNLIFMTGVLLFARGRRRGDWRLHAAAGALVGIASQFRPNLVLVPIVLAAFLVIERGTRRRVVHAGAVVLASLATLVPWAIRTERLAGEPMLTTTRGAVQLWYGTLQSGPYLKNWARHPRAAFEFGSFPYTTLDRLPLVVTGLVADCAAPPAHLAVVYWSDRDREHRRVPVQWPGAREFTAWIPPSPAPTTYYVDVEGAVRSGDASPYVYFVSADHLGDLDRHDDLFDAFDLIRMMRTVAWSEPLPMRERLDFDGDGRVSERDVRIGAGALLARARAASRRSATLEPVGVSTTAVTLRLEDGALRVPREWSRRITDAEATGESAAALVEPPSPTHRSRRRTHRRTAVCAHRSNISRSTTCSIVVSPRRCGDTWPWPATTSVASRAPILRASRIGWCASSSSRPATIRTRPTGSRAAAASTARLKRSRRRCSRCSRPVSGLPGAVARRSRCRSCSSRTFQPRSVSSSPTCAIRSPCSR